jgi:hypothetical protein
MTSRALSFTAWKSAVKEYGEAKTAECMKGTKNVACRRQSPILGNHTIELKI